MSQFSAPIEYIVDHILPNYSDDELSGMLRAIIQEMGERVAREGGLA